MASTPLLIAHKLATLVFHAHFVANEIDFVEPKSGFVDVLVTTRVARSVENTKAVLRGEPFLADDEAVAPCKVPAS
jgi:hypothetical protein